MRPALRLLIVAVCLSFAQPYAARAQTNAPPPLPPAAQEALNKGIIAAKVPDYLLAIRYFQEARKSAPKAPVVYLNLGIAESKIPGRELRAMAWLGAYLAASPDAPNAAAVKQQIAVLDVRNQSNVSRLIKAVQDAADQATGDTKDLNLVYVAEMWAKAGDITMALRTAEVMQGRKGQAQNFIVKAQAVAGDIAGAQKTSDLIQKPFFLLDAKLAIAEAQIKADDVAGSKRTLATALKTADLFKMPWSAYDKSSGQIEIAELQLRAGDIAGARKTLASALKTSPHIKAATSNTYLRIAEAQLKAGDIAGARNTTDLIKDEYKKSDAQQAIANAQINAGDFPGARKTLASAQKTVVLLRDASVKNARLSIIAKTQLKVGDISGAQRAVNLIQRESDKSYIRNLIAEAQIKTGDIAGARATINLIQDAMWKKSAESKFAQAKAGIPAAQNSTRQLKATTKPRTHQPPIQPVIKVTDWLKKLDDRSGYGDCPLNTGPFLDLTRHLKSLPPSDKPQMVFDGLKKTAQILVSAQNVITGMLKQQAKR